MTDEPGQTNKSFAEPGLTLRGERADSDNCLSGEASEVSEVDERHSDATALNVEPSKPAMDDGDTVVAPYVPPIRENSKPEGTLAQSSRGQVAETRARRTLPHSKRTFTLLAVVLSIVWCFCLYWQRLTDQEALDRHSELAQLNEYGQRDHESAIEWSKAIEVAKRMQLPAKVIADLDMRAAKAWKADLNSTMVSLDDKIVQNRDTLVAKIIPVRRAELQEAVTLYARSEDCQASQITASWDLLQSLTNPGGWHSIHMVDLFPCSFEILGIMHTHDNLASFWQQYPELAKQFKDVPKRETSYAGDIFAKPDSPLNLLAQAKLSPSQAQALIPAMHDNVCDWEGTVVNGELMLDKVLRQAGYDPSSFKDRLKLAKDAVASKDYQAAIVEYIRCLGIKDDEETRHQFLQACELMERQSTEYNSQVRDHQEALSLLVKLHKLESSCFGEDSDQALKTIIARVRVLSALRRFDEAEKLLDALPPKQQTISIVQKEKGMLLATSGKFRQAATILRQAGADPELSKIYAFMGDSRASGMQKRVKDNEGRGGRPDQHPGASDIDMTPDAYGAPTLE